MKTRLICDYDITDPGLAPQRHGFFSTVRRTQSLRAGFSGLFQPGKRTKPDSTMATAAPTAAGYTAQAALIIAFDELIRSRNPRG